MWSREVADFFRQQYARAIQCGIDPMAIAFDPGIGFGKTLEHNLELAGKSGAAPRARIGRSSSAFRAKSFLGKIAGNRRKCGSTGADNGTDSLLRARGAEVLRVHDVEENVGGFARGRSCAGDSAMIHHD